MSPRRSLRRREEGRTDYRQRPELLKSFKPRLVVRRSNKHFTAQLVEYGEDGDEVQESAHSSELEGFGWLGSTGNTPAAYLTGFLLGKRSGEVEATLDVGLNKVSPGSSLFAVAEGARDAGVDVSVGEEVLPSEGRTRGEHIAEYADEGPFSDYEERGLDPSELPGHFDEVKKNLGEEV